MGGLAPGQVQAEEERVRGEDDAPRAREHRAGGHAQAHAVGSVRCGAYASGLCRNRDTRFREVVATGRTIVAGDHQNEHEPVKVQKYLRLLNFRVPNCTHAREMYQSGQTPVWQVPRRCRQRQVQEGPA